MKPCARLRSCSFLLSPQCKKKRDAGRSTPARTNRLKSGDEAEKNRKRSAQARSAAARKAAQTRARRATVLKTLKTGKESFSREGEKRGS